jgi:hypothetical protein
MVEFNIFLKGYVHVFVEIIRKTHKKQIKIVFRNKIWNMNFLLHVSIKMQL